MNQRPLGGGDAARLHRRPRDARKMPASNVEHTHNVYPQAVGLHGHSRILDGTPSTLIRRNESCWVSIVGSARSYPKPLASVGREDFRKRRQPCTKQRSRPSLFQAITVRSTRVHAEFAGCQRQVSRSTARFQTVFLTSAPLSAAEQWAQAPDARAYPSSVQAAEQAQAWRSSLCQRRDRHGLRRWGALDQSGLRRPDCEHQQSCARFGPRQRASESPHGTTVAVAGTERRR